MSAIFSWEKEYKKTWEDKSQKSEGKITHHHKYKYGDKKKGLLRHLHIVIDTSYSIDKSDFLPTFRINVLHALEKFIKIFYEENPISKITLATVSDTTNKICIDNINIKELLTMKGEGCFSLYNAIHSSINVIKNSKFFKEVLIITPSLTIKDPESCFSLVDELKKSNTKVHIISLCGELMIYKKICQLSNGRFYVPLDSNDLNYILKEVTLPIESRSVTTDLTRLGFPLYIQEKGVCVCHFNIIKDGYECPECKSYLCTLPMECPVCGLHSVSTTNILKSYHHLYKLKEFIGVDDGECTVCQACAKYMCPKCSTYYCQNCSDFIHTNFNFCLKCDLPNNVT